MTPFIGAKIALLYDGKIISIQRDDIPEIPFPDMWNLPGGGRENEETPIQTAQREVFEELQLTLNPADIFYIKEYPAVDGHSIGSYFLAATISQAQIDSIVFGNEGQGWRLVEIEALINEDNVVPHIKDRLRHLLRDPAMLIKA